MKKLFLRALLALVCCFALVGSASAQIAVKTGEKVAFLGDSITQFGNSNPTGYVQLVMAGLKANGVNATSVPAGVSGNVSTQMLARLDRDVISKKPDWMTLSCGVNDVWHGEKGVALEDYKTTITQIVEKATAANIKVVILTSTPIKEDYNNDLNQKLIPYNDFLRQLAKDKTLPLADLNADMRTARAATNETNPNKNVLTVDGVHMNPAGDKVMAVGVLRALGANDAQIAKAQDAWLDLPTPTSISVRQMEQLKALAAAQNKSVEELIHAAVEKYLANPAKP